VVGSQFKVKAISPGQIRHKEPFVKFDDVAPVVFLDEHHIPPVLVKRADSPAGGTGLWFSG
jgi:hypothetical protein